MLLWIYVGLPLVVLFVLWLLWGGGDYEYIGLQHQHREEPQHRTHNHDDDICYHPEPIDISPSPYEEHHQLYQINSPVRITYGKHRSRGERICCEVMEELTGRPFGTTRSNFLKNPETGRNLEIDCYNHELRIGVEYNGEQHYKWPNHTGMTEAQFIQQLRRDKFKVDMCDAYGVYLITVPYTVPHNQIREYIIERLPQDLRETLPEYR